MGAEDAGDSSSSCRSCATWPAISRRSACARSWCSIAKPASRLGITPAMIDQTLYDSYGQRQVSTMFTQLNQYHVILEVEPQFQRPSGRPARSVHPIGRRDGRRAEPGVVSRRHRRRRGRHVRPQRRRRGDAVGPAARGCSRDRASGPFGGGPSRRRPRFPNGNQVAAERASLHVEPTTAPITINHQGQFPVVTLSFNLAPGASLGAAVDAVEQAKDDLQMPAQHPGSVPGCGGGVRELADQRAAADSRGRRHRLHRARRAVRELHPPADDSLDAAVGRRRRAAVPDPHAAPTSASSRSSASSCSSASSRRTRS